MDDEYGTSKNTACCHHRSEYSRQSQQPSKSNPNNQPVKRTLRGLFNCGHHAHHSNTSTNPHAYDYSTRFGLRGKHCSNQKIDRASAASYTPSSSSLSNSQLRETNLRLLGYVYDVEAIKTETYAHHIGVSDSEQQSLMS
jgi:hypothetical protein